MSLFLTIISALIIRRFRISLIYSPIWLAFAAGVFIGLGMSFLHSHGVSDLVESDHSMHEDHPTHEDMAHNSWWIIIAGLGSVGIGWLAIYIVRYFINGNMVLSQYRSASFMVGSMLHRMSEGVIILGLLTNRDDPFLGIIFIAGILIHEVSRELATMSFLFRQNYKSMVVYILSFSTSIPMILFSLLFSSFYLLLSSDLVLFVLGISAGFFLFPVIYELTPYIVRSIKEKRVPFSLTVALGSGVLVSMFSDFIVHFLD